VKNQLSANENDLCSSEIEFLKSLTLWVTMFSPHTLHLPYLPMVWFEEEQNGTDFSNTPRISNASVKMKSFWNMLCCVGRKQM